MAAALQCATATPPGTLTLRIAVDKLGYLPDLTKMAVISDPQVRFNVAAAHNPGGAFAGPHMGQQHRCPLGVALRADQRRH